MQGRALYWVLWSRGGEKDHTVEEEDRLHQKLKNSEKKQTDKEVFLLLFYLQSSTRIVGAQGGRN